MVVAQDVVLVVVFFSKLNLVLDLDENLGEFEIDVFARQLLVNCAKGFHFMLDLRLLGFVQKYLHSAAPVKFYADPLANNFSGENQIVEDGRVNGSQSSAAWPLLLLLVPRFPRGFGQDASLGDEDDVAPAELLLQLSNESRLDLLVGFELGDGNENDDRLAATANVHLLRGRHV